MQDTVAQFWADFQNAQGIKESVTYADCYYFGHHRDCAEELLQLVLAGKKQATSSSLPCFTNHQLELPKPGDYCIITDFDGIPHCVVETTNVMILPFQDMTYEICKKEGEDDSLTSWQEGHIRFFTEEGVKEGYTFSWDMPIVFEEFRVVYQR